MARFDLLFMADHELHTTLRRLFFQNVLYNPETGGLPDRLIIYVALLIEEEKWDIADCMTDVLAAVHNRYNWQDLSQQQQDPLNSTAT